MIKYDKYKRSGIEWIGEIPNHWWKLKIGRSFNQIGSGTTPQSGSDTYYEDGDINWLNTGDLNDSYITETKKKITAAALKEFSTLKMYPKDSIVIALYGATIGKLGHLQIETTTNQACCVLSDSDDIENRYLFYFLLSAREYIISRSYGGGQPNISQDLIKQLYISAPTKAEQSQIVKYLDHQTDIINQLIQQKEKLIELLKYKRQAIINEAVTKGLNSKAKMNDSGIKGVGMIPAHWSIKRLKQITDAYGRIGYRGYTTSDIVSEGEGAITISPSNMKGDYMTFEDSTYISWDKYHESPEIQIFNNDVLMVKTGSTYGKVGLVKNLDKKATINPQVLVFKNLKINPDYLFNLLRTPLIKNQIETNVIGSTIPTMSQTKILNFQIVIPPASEIEQILHYINNSMIKVDQLNLLIFNQIEKLKEYRQSMIFEVVTGKIDVREWQPKKQQVA